jgi:hypothetical protein
MRTIKIVCVMFFGPALGIVAGFIVGGLLVPPDSTGRGAPGEGFLILYCTAIGFVLCVLASTLVALRFWRRPSGLKSGTRPT